MRSASAATHRSAARCCEITVAADGQGAVRGALTFATARRARDEGLRQFGSAHALQLDCAGITTADSAGLTVLLDWLAHAKQAGKSLRYVNLPQDLLAIARISDVEELLQAGV